MNLLDPNVVVRLSAGNSSDPRMRVLAVSKDGKSAICAWFKDGAIQQKEFPISALIASKLFERVTTTGNGENFTTIWELYDVGDPRMVYNDVPAAKPVPPAYVATPADLGEIDWTKLAQDVAGRYIIGPGDGIPRLPSGLTAT